MIARVLAVVATALTLAACGEASPPQARTEPQAVASAGASTAATAQTARRIADPAEAKRIAHDRHEGFEEIGKAFKTINDQLKAGSPDLAKIADRAAVIDRYAPQIATWFPAGTGRQDGVKTHALATVWSEPERFAQANAGIVDASARFLAAARSNDLATVRAAVKPLGQACKTCHDHFREEDDD